MQKMRTSCQWTRANERERNGIANFLFSQLPPLFFLFCSLSRIVPSSSPLPLGKKASAPHAKEQKTKATTHSPKAMTERELIDLKQRLLPQYLGRAQRAEHERDALRLQRRTTNETVA